MEQYSLKWDLSVLSVVLSSLGGNKGDFSHLVLEGYIALGDIVDYMNDSLYDMIEVHLPFLEYNYSSYSRLRWMAVYVINKNKTQKT